MIILVTKTMHNKEYVFQLLLIQLLSIHRVMRTTTITIAELLQENIDLTFSMNKLHVDGQIMRVITLQAK